MTAKERGCSREWWWKKRAEKLSSEFFDWNAKYWKSQTFCYLWEILSFNANRTLDAKKGAFVELSVVLDESSSSNKQPKASNSGPSIIYICFFKWNFRKFSNGSSSFSSSLLEVKYYVSVKTGDKMNAGTDSNVHVSLYGSKSAVESIALDAGVSRRAAKTNLFERASLDEFEFEANDVGKVTQFLRIFRD